MTTDEVRTIAQIMRTADGGCKRCTANLFRQFCEHWPEHEAVLDRAWIADDYDESKSWKEDST